MRRLLVTCVLSVCLASTLVPTRAAGAGALCSRDEVLLVAQQEVRKRSHYAELDASSILEWSTDDPNIVRCTALVHVLTPYARAGNGYVAYREQYHFGVRVTGRRFTVTFTD